MFAGTVLALFASTIWWLDLICHFKLLIVILSLCLIPPTLLKRRPILLAMCIACILVNGPAVASFLISPTKAESADNSSRPIRVAGFNVWRHRNQNYKSLLEFIEQTKPDIVGFSELDKGWKKTLAESLEQYPYKKIEWRFGGVAVFSKYPLENAEVKFFRFLGRPRIEATARIDGQPVRLIFFHPINPTRNLSLRNKELEEISREAAATSDPVIVFGDLNCTPWSPIFVRILRQGRLFNTMQGFGPQPSWPAVINLPFMPIDHILVSKHFRTIKRKTGPNLGSDHLPVYADLQLLKEQDSREQRSKD